MQSEPGEPGCIACKKEDRGFNLIERTAKIGLYNNNTTTLVIIQIGEEITDCYGFHYTSLGLAERRRRLEKWFNFTCGCVACKESYPVMDSLTNRLASHSMDQLRHLLDNFQTALGNNEVRTL